VKAPVVARHALGAIRLVNGVLALVAPRRLVKQFGEDPAQHGPAVYALRLFGVRTIVLGVQLLTAKGEALDDALRYAVPIHASDTASAALATASGALPRKAGLTGVGVSSLNTVLAVIASRGHRRR
jgi:hypothetical protein